MENVHPLQYLQFSMDYYAKSLRPHLQAKDLRKTRSPFNQFHALIEDCWHNNRSPYRQTPELLRKVPEVLGLCALLAPKINEESRKEFSEEELGLIERLIPVGDYVLNITEMIMGAKKIKKLTQRTKTGKKWYEFWKK